MSGAKQVNGKALTTMLGLLVTIMLGIVTWVWKVDDRVFELRRDFMTKQDAVNMEGRLSQSITAIADRIKVGILPAADSALRGLDIRVRRLEDRHDRDDNNKKRKSGD